jgi:hypothetical protein
MANELLLEPGARLVHVGAHKTGTTATQGAFSLAGDRLAEHGVSYFGPAPGQTYLEGALAVSGAKPQQGMPVPDMCHWTGLAAEVAAQGDHRVLVSSAFFGDGDAAAAARVVEDLGGSRVHVVVTLRPLTRVLPSQWQQYVQNGLRLPYEDWLDGILNRPPDQAPTRTFWRRHQHDELVARWAEAAGAGNVIAVVVDEGDRFMLLRTFEQMLGLPGGFLVLDDAAENRSLTLGEVELVRLLNEEIKRREWPETIYAMFMKAGVLRQLKAGYQPGPGEPRVTTPAWALKRAAEIDTEIAGRISALGVRVVGDVSSLCGPPDAGAQTGADAPVTAPVVPAAAAAQAIVGAIAGSKVPGRLAAETQPARLEDRPVRDVDARSLARVLAQRGQRRAARALRRR